MARVLVRHHHEGHSAAGRRVAEELFHGFQPAGGGADSHNQETGRFCGQLCRWSRLRLMEPGIHWTPLATLALGADLGKNCSFRSLSRRSHRIFSLA